MAVIETKYSVGDVVYHAGIATERKQHPCPDCKGTGKWTAMSPAGGEYTFGCPRCAARYHSNNDLSLVYTAHVPNVARLTIGSVRTDSHRGAWGNEEPNSYMCHETGVGSGSVYRESDLFRTEAEAIAVSEARAKLADREQEWCARLYDQTLELSDYQLENALIKRASDYRSEIGSLFWNISDLFDTIAEAVDKDAILEAIDDYKRFTWERDKARFTAQAIEAHRAETGTGSVHESAVRQDAPDQPVHPAATTATSNSPEVVASEARGDTHGR